MSDSKGVAGALVGIVSAISGALTGSAEDHEKYARASELASRANTERTVETAIRVGNDTPSGQSK